MLGWLSREKDTALLAALCFGIAVLLLLLFPAERMPSSAAPAVGSSWARLGDLSRCVGESVALTGTVVNSSLSGSVLTITVLPFSSPIDVTVFPRNTDNFSYPPGAAVRVEGSVREFKGKEDLVADKVLRR